MLWNKSWIFPKWKYTVRKDKETNTVLILFFNFMQRSSPAQEEETKLRNEISLDWSYYLSLSSFASLSSFSFFSLFYAVRRWHHSQWKLQIVSPYRRVTKSSPLVLFILRRVLWTVKTERIPAGPLCPAHKLGRQTRLLFFFTYT